MKLKKLLFDLTKFEWCLWIGSVLAVVTAFLLFSADYLTLAASLIGVTSLIYAAKGNPVGPALMIAFSIMYGVISFFFRYYGELVTYVGMTLPMSVVSLAAWLRHPYQDTAQVAVAKISKKQVTVMLLLTAGITAAFYFILGALQNANLFFSTVSVTTSFLAAYLTFLRSPYFALAYAMNDVVLVVLWSLAAAVETSYIPMVVCFCVFLINDAYGFFNWRRMENAQKKP